MNTQRRTLLLGALSAPAIGLAAGARASNMPLETFIDLSARLCQRPASALDPQMAQRILQVLADQGRSAELLALQQQADPGHKLATELRTAWFSGLMATPAGTTLVGFQHVLAWGSADFLHVPGSCGGPTGYWSQPGQTPV